jgi:putative peptide zinc metalloprotease protein
LYQLFQFFYVPGRMNKVKKNRVWVTLGVVGVVALAIIFIPLPYSVHCTFEVVPEEAGNVMTTVPGTLAELPRVKLDQPVKKGDVIAVLTNPDLQSQLETRRGEYNKARATLEGLRRLVRADSSFLSQISPATEILTASEVLFKSKQEEYDKLTIRAPRDGVILPPPYKPVPKDTQGRLPGWTGSPFEAKNLGATLQRGDMICRVGDPQQVEAVLIIDQTDIDLVDENDEVRLLAKERHEQAYNGRIKNISKIDTKHVRDTLGTAAGGGLNTKQDPNTGATRPLSTSYQASVPLDNSDDVLIVGATGNARIYTGWQSLGTRLYRYVIRTFHFSL